VSRLTVLLVGATGRAEFRDSQAAIESASRVIAARSGDDAIAALDGGRAAVDLIVLAQSYPGEFSGAGVDRLRALAPLARVIVIQGSWCAGESRNGRPIAGTVRVHWHEFPARCAQELASLGEGRRTAWALPATASDEERLLATPSRPAGGSEGLVVVCSPDFEIYDWLASTCRRRGLATLWRRPGQSLLLDGAWAGIFDALEAEGEGWDGLRRFAAAIRPAPVVVLLQFPRVEDRQRVLAAGAAAVLSKPLALDELDARLDGYGPGFRQTAIQPLARSEPRNHPARIGR
jgi:DNA-binding response OmpR family regulator